MTDKGGGTPKRRTLPMAPYPPMMLPSGEPSRPVIRSSLSSSPHFSSPPLHALETSSRTHTSSNNSYSSNNSNSPSVFQRTNEGGIKEVTSTRGRSRSFGEQSSMTSDNLHRAKPVYSSIRFHPTRPDLYGSINFFPNSAEQPRRNESMTTGASTSRGSKLGPILLELGQLSVGTNGHHGLLSHKTIGLSRGNPQLGSSVMSTCLSFCSNHQTTSYPEALAVVATGLTTGTLCLHTFMTGDTTQQVTSSVEHFPTRYHRASSSVAWRPNENNHVAIGLVASGSTGGVGGSVSVGGASGVVSSTVPSTVGTGLRRVAPHRTGGGGGGDRDFCCLIWDVETQTSNLSSSNTKATPFTKLSYNAGVASLAWLSNGNMLAVGCQMRSLHLYDLRMSSLVSSASPINVGAHNEAVLIEPDPERSHILATFSRSPGEPVKLWDLRRMDSSVGEIKLGGLPTANSTTTTTTRTPTTFSTSRFYQPSVALNPTSSSGGIGTATSVAAGPVVSQIAWSSMQRGILSVAVENMVYHYDTTISSGSRPLFLGISHTALGRTIVDMAVNPLTYRRTNSQAHAGDGGQEGRNTITEAHSMAKTEHENGPTDSSKQEVRDGPNSGSEDKSADGDGENVLFDLLRYRMLVMLADRTLCDVPKHTGTPLAVSRRDGSFIHGYGRSIWVRSTEGGTNDTDINEQPQEEDISMTIKRRASCKKPGRYSMDAKMNMEVLSLESNIQTVTPTISLSRLWSWVARVEKLCDAAEEMPLIMAASSVWPAKGNLTNVGVWQLLGMNKENDEKEVLSRSTPGYDLDYSGNDNSSSSTTLACAVYDSPGRRAALSACGWGMIETLGGVLKECESRGEFERAAALAVWHDDINAAVEVLQYGAEKLRTSLSSKEASSHDDDGDHDGGRFTHQDETLELVSMCIAGYNVGPKATSSKVWNKACLSLLRRKDLVAGDRAETMGASYVRSMLQFLLKLGEGNESKALKICLDDSTLSLCDRVAFGCRFLPQDELRVQLRQWITSCQKDGNLEGLVITGTNCDGIKILQAYVDTHADVQTAALVTSRVFLPTEWTWERRVCSEWLDSYRAVLNSWQLWQSRAMFDVDRAEILRQANRIQNSAGGASSTNSEGAAGMLRSPGGGVVFPITRRPLGAMGSASKIARKKPAVPQGGKAKRNDPDLILDPSTPTQLEARCNFCSLPLSGARRQEGVDNQWLSKCKPVLSCCPRCHKPLPTCAICLLPLGCLNPYMELRKERTTRHHSFSQPRGIAGSGAARGDGNDLSSLANLPFAEWFTWCMFCKHGGHAQHMVGWFANHDTCPVSGCNCRCQFDTIEASS